MKQKGVAVVVAAAPGEIDLFFCVLSLAMFIMITRLILDDGDTFAVTTLLTTVLGNHVQLSNAILCTQS